MELYYFSKDNCAPCKAAKPIVERTAKALGLTVHWLDVRSPDGEAYISPWNLMTVPTLVVAEQKHKVASFVGADLQNATKLTKQLEKLRG